MRINVKPPYYNISKIFSQIDKHVDFEKKDKDDSILLVPDKLGSGKIWYRDVMNGMALMIIKDLTVKEKTIIHFEADKTLPAFAFVFCDKLNGHATLEAQESDFKVNFQQGAYMMSSAIHETHTYIPGGKNNFVGLFVLQEFIEKYLEGIFKEKKLIIKNGEVMKEIFLQIPSLNTDIKMALHALENNSFTGELRNMYLESKVFELITLFFHQFEHQQTQKTLLRKKEKELVYQAQQILDEKLETPPSITELSRMVGLNEYKLREGFRLLFDNTIYGYLRQQRMFKAKLLMEKEELTVSEAGNTVGYTNLSHFAEAFKKEFGMNPSQVNGNKNILL